MAIDNLWEQQDDNATNVAANNDTTVTPDATQRDMPQDAATVSRQDSDSATTMSRQDYTLTVEDVAVTLADHNIYRDPRTIQRWCKSGRLECILDQENGERYLITAKSLEKIVATLTADRERVSRRQGDTPRKVPRHDGTHRDVDATVSRQETDSVAAQPDAQSDPEPERQQPAPETESDTDSQLKQRISELETELAMTKADKQVREQMVDYLKEQFSQMLDGTLERAEEIGKLREENSQLKNLLLSPSSTTGNSEGATDMYNMGNETSRQFDEQKQFPPATPLHDDLSPGADRTWPERQ